MMCRLAMVLCLLLVSCSPGVGPVFDAGSDSSVDGDSDTDGDTDGDTDIDTDTDSDADSDSDTDTETESETDTETETESDTGTGEDTDSETDSETDTGPEMCPPPYQCLTLPYCIDSLGGSVHSEFSCSPTTYVCCEVPECTSGVCCDTATSMFRPSSYACDVVDTEYTCDGTGCGADAQERDTTQYCSGTGETCNGSTVIGGWTTVEDCGVDFICEFDMTDSWCTDCPYGCTSGSCEVPECTSGDCCDTSTGTYRPDTYVCYIDSTEYSCNGIDCGSDAIKQDLVKKCSGSSELCDGSLMADGWTVHDDCNANAICEHDPFAPTVASFCTDCGSLGCVGGACETLMHCTTLGFGSVWTELWVDSVTGYTWHTVPFTQSGCYDQDDAENLCANLNCGGKTDWELPTISTFRTLIRGCPATETGGSCGITDSCLDFSCFGGGCLTGCIGIGPDLMTWPPEMQIGGPAADKVYWSVSDVNELGYDRGIYVNFNNGTINQWYDTDNHSVRCVRTNP